MKRYQNLIKISLVCEDMMTITLNGRLKDFQDNISLKAIVQELCRNTDHAIAELNGSIVKKQDWEKVLLKHNDVLELVNFVGGG